MLSVMWLPAALNTLPIPSRPSRPRSRSGSKIPGSKMDRIRWRNDPVLVLGITPSQFAVNVSLFGRNLNIFILARLEHDAISANGLQRPSSRTVSSYSLSASGGVWTTPAVHTSQPNILLEVLYPTLAGINHLETQRQIKFLIRSHESYRRT